MCELDLAPEAPWRCPENCASYEVTLIDGTFEQGSFTRPEVEAEPDEAPDAIGDLLDDAERIVDEAEPDVLRELSAPSDRRKWWQLGKRRKPPNDGEDWHFSSR